jgi:hypothetical protein
VTSPARAMRARAAMVAVSAAVAIVGCMNSGENQVIGLSGTGMVRGVVFRDLNGSRVIDAGDDSVPGLAVRLVLAGQSGAGFTEVTGADGSFRFTRVPVGSYALRVDSAILGDTAQVVRVDSAQFTVSVSDTVRVNVLVGLPFVTVADARTMTAGRDVFVAGVATSGATTFSDSTAGFADTSGAIRLSRVRGTFLAGDSLRVRVRTAQRDGQPVLDNPTIYNLGRGFYPGAAPLTTATAASAAAGARDAELVVVRSATISDTVRTTTSFILTGSDGSGPLQIELDQAADSAFRSAKLPGPYIPGATFDVDGVLVPAGVGMWRLRPRSAADLTLIPLPVISIAAARALPVGRTVSVVGVALNSSTTFADTTVFLADTSGAIQMTRLRTAVTAGDSVRVLGTTSTRNGRPSLDGGTTTALGTGFYPAAATLTTASAATAAGGTRDAQLVVVRSATVSDTSRTSTSFLVTVSDGSGPLVVQLDRTADPAFQQANLPGGYVPGNKFDILGVLAPTGTGTWRLRPRSATDLTEIPLPVISIAAARALPVGQFADVVGVALNGSTTFSDTTVSLADTSGAIRLTRLRATVAAGDSIRVHAVTGTRSGQPTLDGGTVTALGHGFYSVAPTLTTSQASGAVGGTRDAQLVIVNNATISDTATVVGGFRLHVSDGSGSLEVLLDPAASAAFTPAQLPGAYVPQNRFNLIGILVPTGTGTWRLKPRSAADMTKL